MRAEDIAAILLAAGRSARFGPENKLAAPLNRRPLAWYAAAILSHIPFGHRIVVTSEPLPVEWDALGFAETRIAPGLAQSDSIIAGVRRLSETNCKSCLIALADMPFIPQSHFEALIDRCEGPVMATGNDGLAMVPALFAREYWDSLMALSGDNGARALLKEAPLIDAPVHWLVDIDFAADLARFTLPAADQ